MSAKVLTWLVENEYTRHGHAILRVLPQQEAEAILFARSAQNPAWVRLIDKQRLFCKQCSEGLFGLYQFFSDSWRYVGIGA